MCKPLISGIGGWIKVCQKLSAAFLLYARRLRLTYRPKYIAAPDQTAWVKRTSDPGLRIRDMQAAVWFFQRGAITAVHPQRRLDYDATLYCGCFVHKVETQEFRSCSGPKLTLSPHIRILIGCWRESMDVCLYVGHEVKRHRERTNLFYLFREPFQGQAGPFVAVRVRLWALTFIDFIVHCSTFHSKVL